MKIHIDPQDKTPIYKQLIIQIEGAVRSGKAEPGFQLPSMNELAEEKGISRETVKKAYSILVKNGVITPKQGKGYYVNAPSNGGHPKVLVVFDKFSVYKQVIFNALNEALEGRADITVVTHNQSADLLEYYLDTHLDNFDWYVVSPHFPLDSGTTKRILKLISRIPNRKLIMIDHWLKDYPGKYGAVYQDFENDVYDGLQQGAEKLARAGKLRVITLPSSLYGPVITRGIERFVADNSIDTEFLTPTPKTINAGDVFLILNSQLDWGLADLARKAGSMNLEIGKDIFVIAYNEFPINDVVLGGLTTISTDFAQMGRLAAEMILSGVLTKKHCEFRMNSRHTF